MSSSLERATGFSQNISSPFSKNSQENRDYALLKAMLLSRMKNAMR
jgi:hypothetical protein